jgi:sec-independent protein translocase protein TatA
MGPKGDAMHVLLRVPAMVGYQDLLVGLVLLVFFFGAKRLPEMAGSLGKSMREFKKAVSEDAPETAAEAAAQGRPTACAGCAAPLEAGWAHCPRCGAAVTPALPPRG